MIIPRVINPFAVEEEEVEAKKPPFFSPAFTPAPSPDPLEASIGILPQKIPTVVSMENNPYQESIQQRNQEFIAAQKEKELLTTEAMERGSFSEREASRFAETQMFVNQLNSMPDADRQAQFSQFNKEHRQRMTDDLILAGYDNELREGMIPLIDEFYNLFSESTKKFIATPNGPTTPYAMLSDFFMRTGKQHREYKTDYHYLVTDAEIRKAAIEALEVDSVPRQLLENMDRIISENELKPNFGEHNYYNHQEFWNNIGINLVSYGMDIARVGMAAAGVGGAAKAAGLGTLAKVGLGAAKFLGPMAIISMGMMAYFEHQNKEVIRGHAEYFRLANQAQAGKYSMKQLHEAFNRNMRPEFFTKDGTLNSELLSAAKAKGMETSLNFSTIPTYKLHESLGKGNVLFHVPRGFEYDSYSMKGDLMGEVIGTLGVTFPLAILSRSKLTGVAMQPFLNNAHRSLYYGTKINRSIITQFGFDFLQGNMMEYLNDPARNSVVQDWYQGLIELSNEYSSSMITTPLIQQAANFIPRMLAHGLGSRVYNRTTNAFVIDRVTRDMANDISVLRFAAEGGRHETVQDASFTRFNEAATKGIQARNWAEAIFLATSDDAILRVTPERISNVNKAMLAELNNRVEVLTPNASIFTRAFSDVEDASKAKAAIESLKGILKRGGASDQVLDGLFKDKTLSPEQGRYILSALMDDSNFESSNIIKYLDGNETRIGLFREVVVDNIPGTRNVLRVNIGIDDMVEIYTNFYSRVEGDTKVLGSGRIQILQDFSKDMGDVLLSKKPVLDISDIREGSLLRTMVETGGMSLETLESMRLDFSSDAGNKLRTFKDMIPAKDFADFVNETTRAASVGFSNKITEGFLAHISGKLTNTLSAFVPELVERFHKTNTQNRVSISGGFLLDVMDKYRSAIDNPDSDVSALNRNMTSVVKVVAEDLKAHYQKDTETSHVDELRNINELISKLDSRSLDTEEVKYTSEGVAALAEEAGYISRYRGILSDLIRVEQGKMGELGNEFMRDEDIAAKASNILENHGKILDNTLTSLNAIRENGFGGLYKSLEEIETKFNNNNIQVDILEKLNIRDMLGHSDEDTTIKAIRARASSPTLNNLVLFIGKKQEIPTRDKVASSKGLDPAEIKNIKETFNASTLQKAIAEAINAKKISTQLMLDMQRTRSYTNFNSPKTLGSALFQLGQIMKEQVAPGDERYSGWSDKVNSAVESVRNALINNGSLPEKIMKTIVEISGRIKSIDDVDSDLDRLVNIIRGLNDVENPIIKQMLDANEGLFTDDIARALGLSADTRDALHDSLSRYFRIYREYANENEKTGTLLDRISKGLFTVSSLKDDLVDVKNSDWVRTNAEHRNNVLEIWSAVLRDRNEGAKVERYLNELDKRFTEEAGDKTAKAIDYAAVYDAIEKAIKNDIYTLNSTGRTQGLFTNTPEGRVNYGRKIHPSMVSLSSIPKVIGLSRTITETLKTAIARLTTGATEKTEDSVIKALHNLSKLVTNKEILTKLTAELEELATPEEKLLHIQKVMDAEAGHVVQRAVLAGALQGMGFGYLNDKNVSIDDVVKKVSEGTRSIPLYGVLPHLKMILGHALQLREVGEGLSRLSSESAVNATLTKTLEAFQNCKSMVQRFKENQILNLLPDNVQMILFNALDQSLSKSERMIREFYEKFNLSSTSERDKQFYISHSKDYFDAAFGWTDMLVTVLRSFNNNLFARAAKQGNMLFDDDLAHTIQRSFGSITHQIKPTGGKTIAEVSARAEALLHSSSFLGKTSHQVKQIWSAITNSTLYNKAVKRTVFDPYYGLSPDLAFDMRKWNTERDDFIASLGTIAHKIGLNPKNPASIREFGRSTYGMMKFTTPEGAFDERAITAYNMAFNRSMPLNPTAEDMHIARVNIVSRIINIGPGKQAREKDIVADRMVTYIKTFEKHGILDLILEHSAEYCVSRDKINSFSFDPSLANEKKNMLRSWDEKLVEKIQARHGGNTSEVLRTIRNDIDRVIGPEASMEDALIFNSLLLTDFTGKLLLSAAVDDTLYKYVGAAMPKLHDGVSQIRNLIDWANILAVKSGEVGLEGLDNFDRSNMLIKMFGDEDINMQNVVNNPINVEGQKFYLMSSLQQSMIDLQRAFHQALSPENLNDWDLTVSKLKDKSIVYQIIFPAFTSAMEDGASKNVQISLDLKDPEVMRIAKRALIGDATPDNFSFLKSGLIEKGGARSGLRVEQVDGEFVVSLTDKAGKFAKGSPGQDAELINQVFPEGRLIISIRDGFGEILPKIIDDVSRNMTNESHVDKIYQTLESINTTKGKYQTILEWANSKDVAEREFNRAFKEHLQQKPLSSYAGDEHTIKADFDGIRVWIAGVDTQVNERAAKRGQPYIVEGLGKVGELTPETLRPNKKSAVELKALADLNRHIFGIGEGEISSDLEGLQAYHSRHKSDYARNHAPVTVVIDGQRFEKVVSIMDFEDYRGPNKPESNKPDIVIRMDDGSVAFISHKAINAEMVDSSDFVLRNSVLNSAVTRALIDYASAKMNEDNKGTIIENLQRNSVNYSNMFDLKSVINTMESVGRNTDALTRAFGSIMTAGDLMEGEGKSVSPFSRDGFNLFMTDIKECIIQTAEVLKMDERPLSELLAREDFREAVWNRLSKTNQWLKAYNSLSSTPEKFTELTREFLNRVFVTNVGGTKGTKTSKDPISILHDLANIGDEKATERKRVAAAARDDQSIVDALLDNLISDSYAKKRATIGNLDKSLVNLLALKPDIFQNMQEGISNLVQRIQTGNFVTKMMMDSGALRYLGKNPSAAQLQEYESLVENGLVKVTTIGELRNEMRLIYPEFIKLLLKSDKLQADVVEDMYRTTRQSRQASGFDHDLAAESLNRYHTTLQKLMNNNADMDSIKLVLSTDLYDQLSLLNDRLTPKTKGNTFGAKLLDSVNAIMTYFTTNFSGAVLILNHVSWMRNIMGAVLQASLSTGDFFTGMEYTARAVKDILAHANGQNSGRYSHFLQDNRPKPLTMARPGASATMLDMSTLDRERHAIFKVAHTVLNRPMEIVNKGIYKGLAAIKNQDPIALEARMRAVYGSVDNINRYALWMMAKDGKVRAPEDYSGLAQLLNKDWAMKRSVEKAFSSDVVDRITSNGKFLNPMSDDDAAAFSRKFSFVYDEMPDFWKLVKAVYNPFASFTYNSYRILHNSLTTYPARVAGLYLAMNVMNNAVLKDQFGIEVALHNFIPNMDVFNWLFGDTDNLDFINIANPSAPFLRFARTIMDQRDPFTKQNMSSFGSAELWFRSYLNSFLPVSPTANFAARLGVSAGREMLGLEGSPYAERGIMGTLASLLPESYLHKKFFEEGHRGKPIDKFDTVVNPLAGWLYGLFGLNVRPTDRLRSRMILDDFERTDKNLTTQLENLYMVPLRSTNKNIQMEIQALENRRRANAERAVSAFHDVYGEVPEYIKQEYLYNNPSGYVQGVKDYITEVWRSALSNIFNEYGRKAEVSVLRR